MKTIPNDIVDAARAAQEKWHVPASVSIAQWALESGWGAHSPGNNCFGIKAMSGYKTQTLATHEVVHGHTVATTASFAKFDDIAQAFEVHAKLIASAPVYRDAMSALPNLAKFVQLMSAHYATDPLYSRKIMSIINAHDLDQYD